MVLKLFLVLMLPKKKDTCYAAEDGVCIFPPAWKTFNLMSMIVIFS